MPKIVKVRPVLLSAPYAGADPEANLEVRLHLPSGLRTTGLVEVTLDNGIIGLGEGYLAVFAPHVFTSILALVSPLLSGREIDHLEDICREMQGLTGYWSLQGAARHVISAVEIALQDCRAQLLGVPLWKALGGVGNHPIKVYASGGDSVSPVFMHDELAQVAAMGIETFKIRARKQQAAKVSWCQREGRKRNISIAVDMAQNLAVPSQTVEDILAFLMEVKGAGDEMPVFLEEVLGPDQIANLPQLRKLIQIPLAGGEIVTTAGELCERIQNGFYDIVQPDATVIGGIKPVMEVFSAARGAGTDVYVHCWGGGVGMLANYHVALACGGSMVEWPLPDYPIRKAMMESQIQVIHGKLLLNNTPGLGAKLTPDIEKEFPFREEAVYNCRLNTSRIPDVSWE